MATNYNDAKSKTEVKNALENSLLPPDIAAKILKSLGSKVNVDEFVDIPTGNQVSGHDLVLINVGGTLDLSGITKTEIRGVDAFVFTANDDVTFKLDGLNAGTFKGVITTSAGNDEITVSGKGVTVSSDNGDDTVTTGIGNDSVNLGSGDDVANTGAGNDSVSGGAGNDSIETGLGNDTVIAGEGNDTVSTGAGNDSVSTGLGNDSVTTGEGNDSVYVGAGNDTVETGAGNDIVKLAAGFTGNANLDGGVGTLDKLDLRFAVITSVAQTDDGLTITLDGGSVITATNFEKFIYDTSTADVDGVIKIVGLDQFVNADFGSSSS